MLFSPRCWRSGFVCSRLTCIKIDIQIRLTHADGSTIRLEPSTVILKRRRASACASATAHRIIKTLKGAVLLRDQILCRQRDTEKLFLNVSSEASRIVGPEPPPHTHTLLLTVMSEDTVQNCLIYACNVSCLFRCRSFSAEPPTVAGESGVNLLGDYLGNINSH